MCPAQSREIVMNRRNMLWSAISGLGAALGASSAKAATEARALSRLLFGEKAPRSLVDMFTGFQPAGAAV
jgi:hypothetical protein